LPRLAFDAHGFAVEEQGTEMTASYLKSPHAKRIEHKAATMTQKEPWKADWSKAIGSSTK
jgi:hypothetical protein